MRIYKAFPFGLVLVTGLVLFSALKLNTVEDSATRLQAASVTISDATFNPADWSVIEVSEGGASQTNRQDSTGGNPGAFRSMQHVLPSPPSPTDPGVIEVAHIYEAAVYDPASEGAIDHIDYAEDTGLLTPPYSGAFVRSFALIEQAGMRYRSGSVLLVTGTTGWVRGSLTDIDSPALTIGVLFDFKRSLSSA